MKKYKIKIWIFILSIIQITVAFAQSNTFVPNSNNAYFFTPQNVGFATPQTAEFTKYGNVNVNYNRGLLDFEIPLYEYKDNDFDIPISLKYVSEGFKPSKRPSLVGYNWILNVGGVITRQVNGSPDDVTGKSASTASSQDYMPDGYLVGARKGNSNYTEDQRWQLKMDIDNTSGNPYIRGDFKQDFLYDVFYFNFGTHSGSFIITDATTATLLTGKGYKISISGLTTQNYSTTSAPQASTIVITTPDGYEYSFGGDTQYLEYYIPNNPDKIWKKPVSIISWYLKSIKAPNQRTVNFSYTSKEQVSKYDYYVLNTTSQSSTSACLGVTYPNNSSIDTAMISIKDRVFVPMLDKIAIDKSTIEFSRNQYNTSFYSSESTYDLYYLQSISIKYNAQAVKNMSLFYKPKDRYFFLDSLALNTQNTNNKEVYKFDYNLTSTLPDPQTISTDHWGFWNGGNSLRENTLTYLNNISVRKAVNTSFFDTGLLKKITYPTGGRTEIEYEYNRYQSYKERDPSTIHLVDKTSTTTIAFGGARIKTIRDFDPVSNKVVNERTYQYKKKNASNESGIIGLVPIYSSTDKLTTNENVFIAQQNKYCLKTTLHEYSTTSSITRSSEKNYAEFPIEYSDVIENFSDGSYICYNYSSLIDTPDDESVNLSFLDYYFTPAYIVSRLLTGSSLYEKFGLFKVNDMSVFRGKLLSKITYSATNDIVRNETYKYNITEAKNAYKITVTSNPTGRIANKIFTTPCRVIQQNITDKNNVLEQTSYQYNDYNLISNSILSRSDGKTQTTKFVYPFEITQGSDLTVMQNMTAKNNLSNYVEKVVYLGSNQVIDGEYRKYSETKANSGIFKPERIDLLPKTAITLNSQSGYYQPEINYKYDSYGNIQESKSARSNETTTYLWSYSYQYPVAEIKNATLVEVNAVMNKVFGVADAEALAVLVTPNETKLKDGSLQDALPNALVTTYTYKPLVGILSITDPHKVTTYYDYDTVNRLKTVKDNKSQSVKGYDYHYKN